MNSEQYKRKRQRPLNGDQASRNGDQASRNGDQASRNGDHNRQESVVTPSSVVQANGDLSKPLHAYDEDDGKILSKSQIKKNLCEDQSQAIIYNKDLDNLTIRNFVFDILVTRGAVDFDVANHVLDVEGIALMHRAFTHWSMANEPNYELLETLGDTSYNKIVVYYMYRRFPQLANDPEGNYKVTEACKLYKSKIQAPMFSDTLQLPSMARYRSLIYRPQPLTFPNKTKQIVMDNKLKTDLFEAFIGAVEELFDTKYCLNTGYAIVYKILQTLFDEIHMTIDLNQTKTAKAKLKELVDRYQGKVLYHKIYNEDDIVGVTCELVFEDEFRDNNNQLIKRRCFEAHMKGYDPSVDKASQDALHWLDVKCKIRWA